MSAKTIKEWLLQKKIFSETELNSFQEAANETKSSLLSYLEFNNLVSSEQIIDYWHSILDYPVVNLVNDNMTDQQLLSRINFNFLRDNALIPIIINGNNYILTAYPDKLQPIEEIRTILQEDLPLALASKSIIIDAVNRFYPLEGTKEMIDELGEEDAMADSLKLENLREEDILGMAQEAPIIKLVNQIIYQAVKRRR